jgi:phospholipid/cholesterol/gamma-HCH transport system permease protein
VTDPVSPTIQWSRPAPDELVVALGGSWRLDAAGVDASAVERELASGGVRRVRVDAQAVEHWDSTLLAFVKRIENTASKSSIEVETQGLPEGGARLLELSRTGEKPKPREEPPHGVLAWFGQAAVKFGADALELTRFLGELTLSLGRLVTRRARWQPIDFAIAVRDCGPRALPIVTLISVLVGLIMGFVGAVQLRQFGADIFVADLVAVAMVREMGSMMAAIIMAGRTGAAFAAHIGTMKVTEEIDALKTFGMPVIDYLVLPRALALSLMMPLLCLYADLFGIAGGALVGVTAMGLEPQLYWNQTLERLNGTDILIGVVKSSVYGVLVATAGCLRGLQCGGSAADVGDAATRAVVTGIVAIIVADGVFAVICNALGI